MSKSEKTNTPTDMDEREGTRIEFVTPPVMGTQGQDRVETRRSSMRERRKWRREMPYTILRFVAREGSVQLRVWPQHFDVQDSREEEEEGIGESWRIERDEREG